MLAHARWVVRMCVCVCVFTQIPHIHKYIAAHFAESEGFLQPTSGGYVELYVHIFMYF